MAQCTVHNSSEVSSSPPLGTWDLFGAAFKPASL
uniref:Uncharacterized protein n=1 Tax=Arundo donax TaxID=35708 RepID=A0A0A9GKX0_ARUDO